MDLERKTFALEELNENFWGKVILVNIQKSKGMGGWGYLWIITSDARCYFIGFEGFPYDERKLEEFAPLFKKALLINIDLLLKKRIDGREVVIIMCMAIDVSTKVKNEK